MKKKRVIIILEYQFDIIDPNDKSSEPQEIEDQIAFYQQPFSEIKDSLEDLFNQEYVENEDLTIVNHRLEDFDDEDL